MDFNYAYKAEKAVLELTQFDIKFCKIYQGYLINYKWTNTSFNPYYNEQIDNAKNLIHNQLKTGLNNKVFLENLITILEKRKDWLEKKNYKSINFFENYPIETVDASYFSLLRTSNKTSFENYSNNVVVPNVEEMKAFWFLDLYKKEFNDYKNINDFEKGLLLYILTLYKHAISNLLRHVKSIFEKVEFIDFNKIKFDDIDDSQRVQNEDIICHVNFDKKKTALLYSLLLEEKIFVFNEFNMEKNRLDMKRFVERNCTYRNRNNKRLAIKAFNREYSEAISVNSIETKKQKEFLDELILKLQTRRNNTKD